MRHSKKVFFVLLSVMVCIAVTLPNTVPARGKASTGISCSGNYFSQDLVLIRSPLARATDTGWQPIITSVAWTQIEVTPDNTLYLYDEPSGSIYRSLDLGQTWALTATFSLTSAVGLHTSFYPSPSRDIVFMMVEDYSSSISDNGVRGLYKSSDGGQTWFRSLPGHERSIFFSREFVLDGTAFASGFPLSVAPIEIWKTTDWGDTWHLVLSADVNHFNASTIQVVVSPAFAQDKTVFGSHVGKGLYVPVYKSVDAGETWSTMAPAGTKSVAVSPNYVADQTLLGIGSPTSLALSQNGGGTWQSLAVPEDMYAGEVGLRVARPFGPITSTLALTGTYQMYLPLISSTRSQPLEMWLVADDNAGNCKLYRSRDEGATWQEISISDVTHLAHLSPSVTNEYVEEHAALSQNQVSGTQRKQPCTRRATASTH
jgi:photosystem II stability/assembly factor-like uncharacterized protein